MNDEERREYVKNVGKGGIQLLIVIDRLRPIVNLWMENDLGKQFLDDYIKDHITLMNKVYDSIIEKGEANREDLLSLKITYGHLKKIGSTINNYDNLVAKGKKQRDAIADKGIEKGNRRGSKKI